MQCSKIAIRLPCWRSIYLGLASTCRTVASRLSNSIGLASNSSHPVAMAFSRSLASAYADIPMIGGFPADPSPAFRGPSELRPGARSRPTCSPARCPQPREPRNRHTVQGASSACRDYRRRVRRRALWWSRWRFPSCLTAPLVTLQRAIHLDHSLGRRTVNTEPLPGSLSTVMSPPIIWQKRLLIASPRPVPPYLRVVEASACENS